ncbi:MAG: CBS domain-containing protein, partial [Pirellulales bacterium]|nr:CBS domain-containing protein [Pirellulales bacterium]
MNSTIERLLSLKVRDAMTESVITISSSNTMSEAADLLKRHHVSGAPVVDQLGRCVGVLSNTDYMRDKAEALHDYPATHVLSRRAVRGAFSCEDSLHDLVSNHMTPAVQTIRDN